MKIVCWVSCGAASAVAAKMMIGGGGHQLALARCVIDNEHPDNDRFVADLENWFGQPVLNLRSADFADCWDVWEKKRYLAGVNGAPCTTEMKKAVRWAFEREWQPDAQAFGFTAEEAGRADRFRQNNPEVSLITPLISAGTSKTQCLEIIAEAGIELPAMYRLGYANNNCIGCVKGGTGYWNKIRVDFPEAFDRMARLERGIGATVCKLGTKGRPRVYLDEMDPNVGRKQKPQDMDCGLLCVGGASPNPAIVPGARS
jgi:hypothetical protein